MNRLTRAIFCSLITIFVLSASILSGCATQSQPATPPSTYATPTAQPNASGANRLEVVYFHRTNRCYSCRYAEDTTRYTITTYFSDELASGELVFTALDLQDRANSAMVEKYGAYSSSLFINEVKNGGEQIENVTDIWYHVGDDEAFVSLVKSEIESHLENI